MPKLSVVIPVYNVEKYLRQCLDSLVNQTLKDIEIICVNDGSTDRSADILQEYAGRDRRVIFVDQKNQGVNAARKNGYKKASGEYLALVDADDWLETDTYERVISTMEKDGSDACIFNYYTNTETMQKEAIGYLREEIIENSDMIYRLSLAGLVGLSNPVRSGRMEGWPWNKVYRRFVYEELEAENQLFIDKVRHFDDALFNVRLMKKCKRLSLSPIYGYHYRMGNTESITGRYYAELPDKKDFMWYRKFGRDLALDEVWDTVLSTMQVNLFWTYLNKHHYFQPQNKQSKREQLYEIKMLLAGKSREKCYFPIKTSLESCNADWISSRIMRFLAVHNMVSAGTLYLGCLLGKYKKRICDKVDLQRRRKQNG